MDNVIESIDRAIRLIHKEIDGIKETQKNQIEKINKRLRDIERVMPEWDDISKPPS